MDIKQLQHFIVVVESDCNLSKAAELLYISQSAISQMIKNFEAQEGILLFKRSRGRLVHLTLAGNLMYEHALALTARYEKMMVDVRELNTQIKGELRIGVAPYIVSTVFSDVVPQIKKEFPYVKIQILEVGAFNLKKKLLANEIDIATLLCPTNLTSDVIEESLLLENELYAFVDERNSLALKKYLLWKDVATSPLAIFDESFMIHHLLMEKFKQEKLKPEIVIQTSYWDILLRNVINNNVITLLPEITLDFIQMPHIKKIPIKDSIKWQIALCRNKKLRYSKAEEHIYQQIISHFEVEREFKN